MIEKIVIFLLLLCFVGFVFCSFMLFRNEWVFKQRINLLSNSMEDFDFSEDLLLNRQILPISRQMSQMTGLLGQQETAFLSR